MAEGARLLSGYGGLTSIAGSNPAFSAFRLVSGPDPVERSLDPVERQEASSPRRPRRASYAVGHSTPVAPIAIAHRGYAALGGENSLAAIGRAVALGCAYVEIDVRVRRDGSLVVDHDDGERRGAPLLADALAVIAASPSGVNLDLKVASSWPAVVEAVRAAGLLQRAVVSGGGWEALVAANRAEPGIRPALTIPRHGSRLPRLVRTVLAPFGRLVLARSVGGLVARQGVDLVTLHHRLVDTRVVGAVHRAGAEAWCWTVDDPREYARVTRAGVDGVCSDDPASHGLPPGP